MKFIELKTEIPGPKGRGILERRGRAVSASLAKATDVVVERADGVLVHDVDSENCGDVIQLKRLAARPVTDMCILCKEEQEQMERSYAQ